MYKGFFSMQKIIVQGKNKLSGKVNISPAKNACLPIIASIIAMSGSVLLLNAPLIEDVTVMAKVIEQLGGKYEYNKNGLLLNTNNVNLFEINSDISKKARASFFIVGALIVRFRKAIVTLPGGCNIGLRPVDIHIDVMKQLGVSSTIEDNKVVFNGQEAKSGKVVLSYPSVGASVNAICLTAFLEGESTLINVAKEPEIVDLCNFLIKCGCKIKGVGSSCLTIVGINPLKNINLEYQPIKDRIEAGTYMCMSAITGGDLCFEFDDFNHIRSITDKLIECGVRIEKKKNEIYLYSDGHINTFSLVADVYPSFPTDMQSVFIAFATKAHGYSVIADRVFNDRFSLCNELVKMGAEVINKRGTAVIKGGKKLSGTHVDAIDLRSGAALICAALNTDGETVIENSKIIYRGYENIVEKLTSLGAEITAEF